MCEQNPDWYMVAKRVIQNFCVFNAEICDEPSDCESNKMRRREEKSESDVETPQHVSFCFGDHEDQFVCDFNVEEFESEHVEEHSPVSRSYEYDLDYKSKSPNTQDFKDEYMKPKAKKQKKSLCNCCSKKKSWQKVCHSTQQQ